MAKQIIDRREYRGCVYRVEPHPLVCDLYMLMADGIIISTYSTPEAARAALEAVAPDEERQVAN